MPNVDPVPYPPPANAVPILKTLTFSPIAGEETLITLNLVDYVPYPKATINIYFNGAPVPTYNDSANVNEINEKFFATYSTVGPLTIKVYANQAYIAAGYSNETDPTAMKFRSTDRFVLSYTFYQVP